MKQKVCFCTSQDGVRLAYAEHGSGPPLVRVATWLTHLGSDWDSPVWRHWLAGLGERHTVLRYDERGCGLSDWEVPQISFETFVTDLELVVDAAARLGERAKIYRQQLVSWHSSLPATDGPIGICFHGDPEDFVTGRKRYSVFAQPSLEVAAALWRAFRLDERPLKLTAVDSPDCQYRIGVVGERLVLPTVQPPQ